VTGTFSWLVNCAIFSASAVEAGPRMIFIFLVASWVLM
jgi:hypothetical protein